MTTELPSGYTFGKVVGQAIRAVGDQPEDTDYFPEAQPIVGKKCVVFTPKIPQVVTPDNGVATMVMQDKIDCDMNAQGQLIRNSDDTGDLGVWLYTGVWTVSFNGVMTGIQSFDILVTEFHAEDPLDLFANMATPISPSDPVTTLVVPSGGTPDQVLTWIDGGLKWVNLQDFPDWDNLNSTMETYKNQAKESAETATTMAGQTVALQDAAVSELLATVDSATRSALLTLSAFDVRAFGATGDGQTDYGPALLAAMDAADALSTKPAVYLPAGTYVTGNGLRFRNGLTVIGDGPDRTTIKGVGTDKPIFWDPRAGTPESTKDNPWTGMLFKDFAIDGYSMKVSGDYNTGAKGFAGYYFKNCVWDNVRVSGTPATGFGADFLQDCIFDHCHAEDCGRLNDGTSPGGAGFGIGTGAYANESHTLIACTAKNCGTFGYFCERQTGSTGALFSSFAKILGGHFENNHIAGICNAGAKRMQITAPTVFGGQYGIAFMPRLTDSLGYEVSIVSAIVVGASSHGFYLTYPQNTQSGRLAIQIVGGQYSNNGGAGLCISTVAGQALIAIDIADPMVFENGQAGIRLTGDGTVKKGRVRAHAFNNAKNVADSGSLQAGVALECATSDVMVSDGSYYDTNVGAQQYGIAFSDAAHVNAMVCDNNVMGNGTKGILPPRGTTATVINNVGHNPLGPVGVPLTGGSPFSYRAGPQWEDLVVLLNGATVESVIVNNEVMASSASSSIAPNMTFAVPPNGLIRLQWSAGTPVLKTIRH